MGTKQNPGAFDCYASAEFDEPMFVLLARDALAPATVRDWAERYLSTKAMLGQFDERAQGKYEEAIACAERMETWRKTNPR